MQPAFVDGMRRFALPTLLASLSLLSLTACGAGPASSNGQNADDSDEGALGLGDIEGDDVKADGNWGAALTCKPIPTFPALKNPRITISINGKTVHVVDPETGYDKVFGVGVGAINTEPTEPEFGESRTYFPILATGSNDFSLRINQIQPCKTWWTDPDTGEKTPVFAGLPFMPFYGGYAMHGPIDNYKAANGGTLRRGYVSHGCVRMKSDDVLELYARIKNLVSVPVRLQREPERLPDGTRVDLADKWIGSECATSADCNYDGGVCAPNALGGRGVCSKACTSSCPDRAGFPTTFCVADPANANAGMCVSKVTAPLNPECRPDDHRVARVQKRFKQTVTANVCVAGSRGWIGDKCQVASDCKLGNSCAGATATKAGVCTQACVAACPDLDGAPWTFCGREPTVSAAGPTCLRECTPASGGDECNAGEACVARTKVSNGRTKFACVAQ